MDIRTSSKQIRVPTKEPVLNNLKSSDQISQPSIADPKPLEPQLPYQRTWIDRFLDALVGKDGGPEHRYALICEKCFVHNGLLPPSEYRDASICESHFRIQMYEM